MQNADPFGSAFFMPRTDIKLSRIPPRNPAIWQKGAGKSAAIDPESGLNRWGRWKNLPPVIKSALGAIASAPRERTVIRRLPHMKRLPTLYHADRDFSLFGVRISMRFFFPQASAKRQFWPPDAERMTVSVLCIAWFSFRLVP